ncbi:MAG: hypothetical protein IBX64_06175 [Actinobacteria bacterium]|nr:hypothetical protein [Actinomycetota bacterium]
MAEEERRRENWSRRGSHGGIIIGLMLASLGMILLIDNLFPGLGFIRLWPVVIIVWGFAVLVSSFLPPFDIPRLFSGIFIGTVGVILLYNTLGIVPFSFWLDLITLWPVLLIAVGLAILGRVTHSKVISALPPVIIILTLILAVIYSDVLFQDRGLTDFKFSREETTDIRDGSASINFAVGSLNIGATDKLYDIYAKESAGREPRLSINRSNSTVELSIEPQNNIPLFRGNREREWVVLLSRDIDWQLNIGTGVSGSELDLSDLRVSELDLGSGAGDISVRFGDRVDQVSASISTGISQLRILVPKSTGVRLIINKGLSRSDFQNIDLQRTDREDEITYETPDFGYAAKRLILDINMGISSFTVEGY